jgi:hypothetical protein
MFSCDCIQLTWWMPSILKHLNILVSNVIESHCSYALHASVYMLVQVHLNLEFPSLIHMVKLVDDKYEVSFPFPLSF